MKNNSIIFTSKEHRVERNARVFSISLRCDKGSNYFFFYDYCTRYLYSIRVETERMGGRVLFYVVMPNHIHLGIEVPNYESLSKILQLANCGFSRYFRSRNPKNGLGKNRFFSIGPRYVPIHNMKQLFNCLKEFYDNPAKWNEIPSKEKMNDVTETYYGSTTSEILKGTSKYFNANALREYTGLKDLNRLLTLLRLPKAEYEKEVERLLTIREWNDELDNRIFKIDPSQPWANSWEPDDVCFEEVTDVKRPKSIVSGILNKFIEY